MDEVRDKEPCVPCGNGMWGIFMFTNIVNYTIILVIYQRRNYMKRLLSMLLVVLLCLTLTAPTTTYSATIKLNKAKITIDEGSSYTLMLSVSKATVKWTSSNKKVATVTAKGVVKGIAKGTANIVATANKIKYTCKVTVKEVFNASKAIDNLSVSDYDLGNGVVAIFKNNYSFPMNLKATVVYYDAKNKMLSKSEQDNNYFEKGKECSISFYGPYDSNYRDVPYDHYEIKLSASKVSDSIISNAKDIKLDSNIGADNVMIEVTNSGKQSSDYTSISVVFFKGDIAVGGDYTYADVKEPGATAFVEFNFPYDSDYNKIQVDNYKVFVDFSYSYNW